MATSQRFNIEIVANDKQAKQSMQSIHKSFLTLGGDINTLNRNLNVANQLFKSGFSTTQIQKLRQKAKQTGIEFDKLAKIAKQTGTVNFNTSNIKKSQNFQQGITSGINASNVGLSAGLGSFLGSYLAPDNLQKIKKINQEISKTRSIILEQKKILNKVSDVPDTAKNIIKRAAFELKQALIPQLLETKLKAKQLNIELLSAFSGKKIDTSKLQMLKDDLNFINDKLKRSKSNDFELEQMLVTSGQRTKIGGKPALKQQGFVDDRGISFNGQALKDLNERIIGHNNIVKQNKQFIKQNANEYKTKLKQINKEMSFMKSTALNNIFSIPIVQAGALAASIFVAAKGIKFFKDSFKQFEQSAKETRKLQAVLKATGNAAGFSAEQLDNFASSLSDKIGQDDQLIKKNLITPLLTFRNISGTVFKQAIGLAADMNTVMGGQGITQLGKALNDPIQGVKALTRVGVTFTKEQINKIKALQESGKLLQAQNLILKQLKNQFQGAAQASATSTQKLTVSWKNFKQSIGQGVSIIANPILDFFTKWNKAAIELNKNITGVAATTQTLAIEQQRKQVNKLQKKYDFAKKSGYDLTQITKQLNLEKGVLNSLIQGLRKTNVQKARLANVVKTPFESDTDTGGKDKFIFDWQVHYEAIDRINADIEKSMADVKVALGSTQDLKITLPTFTDDGPTGQDILTGILDITTAMEQLSDIGANVVTGSIDGIANAFNQAIFEGKNFGKAMQNIFKSLLADITAMIVKMLLMQGIMALLGGPLSSAGGWFGKVVGLISPTKSIGNSGLGTSNNITGVYNSNNAVVNRLERLQNAINNINIQTTYIDAAGLNRINQQGGIIRNTLVAAS